MSFNPLSLARLGIGFGAIAIASLGLLTPNAAEAALGGGIQKDKERELWHNLPDIVQWKPKETVEEVVFIPQVFLPARENVSPEEISAIAKEIAKKIQVAKKITIAPIDESDDEEALFLLGIL